MVQLPLAQKLDGLRLTCKKQELTYPSFTNLGRAGAATKAAMSGVMVEDVMKAANWSGEGTFQKFYYKTFHSVEFGTLVLAVKASKSHVDMETEPSEV